MTQRLVLINLVLLGSVAFIPFPTALIAQFGDGLTTAIYALSVGATGLWQFMYATWNHYQGYETAASAPESVQDAKARELWAGGAGASHWAGNGC